MPERRSVFIDSHLQTGFSAAAASNNALLH